MNDLATNRPPPDPGTTSPHLGAGEQSQAAAHSPLRPRVIHEIIREEGEAELARPASALAWSGLASGLSMGFSFLTQSLLRSNLPETTFRHVIDSFGYSIGFLIVVLGRQQLFTESTLTAVLPVLTRRDAATLLAAARLWAIVLAANLIGTYGFALLIAIPGLYPSEVGASLAAIAQETMAEPFLITLVKAVFAGWLIALMVWLLPSARSAKILVIMLLTYVVALGRFSHIIAGSVEAAFSVITGHASAGQYVVSFLLPTLIGNVIGGVSLVAFLNHAPLSAELENLGD